MANFPVSHPSDLTLQQHVRMLIDCPDFVLFTDDSRSGFIFQVPSGFWGDASDIMQAIIEGYDFSKCIKKGG